MFLFTVVITALMVAALGLYPCDRGTEVLVFTTTAEKLTEIEHSFRMNCTDTLFTAKNSEKVALWREPSLKGDVSVELSFFVLQATMLQTAFQTVLRSWAVELVYEFDTATGEYTFSIVIGRTTVSRCANGVVTQQSHSKDFGEQTSTVVKTYGIGKGIDLLRRNAQTLLLAWRNFCMFLRVNDDRKTDVYDFYYDPRSNNVICLIESRVPWRHLIYIGLKTPNTTDRYYYRENQTHATVGVDTYEGDGTLACTITFPDGKEVTRNLRRSVTTTAVPTTDVLTTIATTTPNGTVEQDTLEEEVSGPNTGSIAAVVVTVMVLGLGLGLFAFFRRRGRRERTVSSR